jgi:hypothetical protein
MNKRLEQAIERVRELPDPAQELAATLLFEFAEGSEEGIRYQLNDEQLVELDRRLAEKDPEVLTMAELRARLRRSGIL